MLDHLVLNNFHSSHDVDIDASSAFVLKTCQRTLVLDYKLHSMNSIQADYQGRDAYFYLLEVICGLKSKLVGENEIVGQFKTAYKSYVKSELRNNYLITILEKLFKDAKQIRTDHLLGLSQKTYASIARKKIVNQARASEVLVLGSGQLAEDLINQFKKKTTVYISARNLEKANKLAQMHDLHIIPWKNSHLYLNFPYIANSIGFNGELLGDEFFSKWDSKFEDKLFVDLGSPSCINSELGLDNGLMRLEEVFKEGAVHESHKINQIKNARSAMTKLTEKRYIHLQNKKRKKLNLGGICEFEVTV